MKTGGRCKVTMKLKAGSRSHLRSPAAASLSQPQYRPKREPDQRARKNDSEAMRLALAAVRALRSIYR